MRQARGYPKPRLGKRPQYQHEVACRLTAQQYAHLVQVAGPEPLGRVVRDAILGYLHEVYGQAEA